MLEVLGRFRLKGFHLSIDDFGTGYSSVSQLLRLPFSELKVDKSFVSGMAHSRESGIVVKTLIDMAHNLGLSAVAEGVETASTLDTLAGWGCDIGQGYLFSKPAPARFHRSNGRSAGLGGRGWFRAGAGHGGTCTNRPHATPANDSIANCGTGLLGTRGWIEGTQSDLGRLPPDRLAACG